MTEPTELTTITAANRSAEMNWETAEVRRYMMNDEACWKTGIQLAARFAEDKALLAAMLRDYVTAVEPDWFEVSLDLVKWRLIGDEFLEAWADEQAERRRQIHAEKQLYMAIGRDHSHPANWVPCRSQTLHGAKAEASRHFGQHHYDPRQSTVLIIGRDIAGKREAIAWRYGHYRWTTAISSVNGTRL